MLLLITKLLLWYAALAHLRPERVSATTRSLELAAIEARLPADQIQSSRNINCRIVNARAIVDDLSRQIADGIQRHTPHPEKGESWWVYPDTIDQTWSPDPCADNDYAFQRHTIETAGARLLIESAQHHGILDELISLSRTQVVVPQKCDTAPLDVQGKAIDGLSSIRRSASLLTAAAFVAHQSGDDLRCAQLLNASIRLGRLADSSGLAIERMIALSILNEAMDRIAQLISLRPLSPAALDLIEAEMNAPPFSRTWTDIASLSIVTVPTATPAYYTEHHRGGMLAWSFVEGYFFGPDISASVFGEDHPFLSASARNTLALFLPRRDWYERRAREYYALLGPWLDLPPLQRRAPHEIDAFLNRLEPGLPYLPQHHSGYSRMGREFDALQCRYHAARIFLAIERYRARHNRPPATLDELIPAELSELPPDYFAPDAQYRYRLLAPDTDVHSRTYLLYSVGFDCVDNKGFLEETYLNMDMLKSDRFGEGDHIVNLPADPLLRQRR